MKKCLTIKLITLLAIFFQQVLFATVGKAQTGESTVDALVEMGFENVGWMEDADERVYVLQNSAYRLQGVGIGKAVDVIQKMGLPVDKPCRIIVLDNNVPQISLYYHPVKGDTTAVAVAIGTSATTCKAPGRRCARWRRKIVLCSRLILWYIRISLCRIW